MTLRPSLISELSSHIADAAASLRPLRLISRGTWLPRGNAEAEPLDLTAFNGIVEFEPGDLTITVGAATTIAELDAVTAAHNLWCPLAPWGGDAGSVGATIATATTGPFAESLGRPRDLVLGLECVDGTGKVLTPGGKVVKNVAGFDLVRLMTGAWGTLAAITRVSLRLRARPAADESWVVRVPGTAIEVQRALRQSATPPMACEVLRDRELLVRIAGNAAFVAAARESVRRAGDAEPCDASAWDALRIAATNREPRTPTDPAVRALNARVKAAFDPSNILNPGVLG